MELCNNCSEPFHVNEQEATECWEKNCEWIEVDDTPHVVTVGDKITQELQLAAALSVSLYSLFADPTVEFTPELIARSLDTINDASKALIGARLRIKGCVAIANEKAAKRNAFFGPPKEG